CYSGSDNGTIGSLDLLFPKGASGSREIALKIKVKPDAPASSSFAFNYKAYAVRKGVVALFPQEEEVRKLADNIAPVDAVKSMCTGKNAIKQLKITSSPLTCLDGGNFCRKIIFDKKSEIPLGSDFLVKFEILSQEPVDTISIGSKNVKLTGSSTGDGFADDNSAAGADTQIASISIPAGIKTSGFLKFSAIRAGTTDLRLSFNTEKNSYKVSKNLRITGDNLMAVSVSPLTLLTGEEKKVTIRALSDNDAPITDAIVTLYDCDKSPLGAEELQSLGNNERNEGQDGRYIISANPQAFGKIGIRVSHPEYKTYDECKIDVGISEDTLTISPSSIKLTGDSTKTIEEEFTISTTLDAKSTVSVISNCGTEISPVIYAEPNEITNFRDSQTITIGILPELTVRKTCNLLIQQRFTKNSMISKTIPIKIDVHGPTFIPSPEPSVPPITSPIPSVDPSADPSISPPGTIEIPGTIELKLDEIGFDNKVFSAKNIGEPINCEIIAEANFRVRAECTAKYVSLTADYIGEALTKSFRKKGQLKITLQDSEPAYYNIVVTALDAFSDSTDGSLNYYSDLQGVPNPIILELDASTRRFDLQYSLGAFGEPVSSCALQNLEYGITTEFCGPVDQKVRLLADFSSSETYNNLLSRIYANNPSCMNYYSQQGYDRSYPNGYFGNGGLGGQGGYGNMGYGGNYLDANLNGGYNYGTGQSYYGGNLQGQYNYNSQPYNQFSDGYYPAPQYSGGYVDYGNYPGMNYQQQPYQYPYSPYTQNNLRSSSSISFGIGNSNIDPRFSAGNCDSGFLEGSIAFLLRSGRRESVAVRIIAKGGNPYPNILGPRQIPCYNCNQQGRGAASSQNEILDNQIIIELDPFTLQRYAQYEISAGSASTSSPLCKVESDPKYFAGIAQNLNYNPLSTSRQSFNPLSGPSTSGKYESAIKGSVSCDIEDNQLQIKLMADASKISIPKGKVGTALNKEDELYLYMNYYNPSRIVLAPVQLSIGETGDYDIEPISNNLQFIVTDKEPSLTNANFKKTDDIFSKEDCKVTGIPGATAKTTDIGEFRSGVGLKGTFAKGNFVLEQKDGKYAFKEVPIEVTEGIFEFPKIPTSPGSLKCDTVKGSVSAKLNFAAIPKEHMLIFENGEKPAVLDRQIDFAGKIGPHDPGKEYGCEISSSEHSKEFDEALKGKPDSAKTTIFSCKLAADSLKFSADYSSFAPKDGFSDQLTLTLYSITNYPKSKLEAKETKRELGVIKVNIKSEGYLEGSLYFSLDLNGNKRIPTKSSFANINTKISYLAHFPAGDEKGKRIASLLYYDKDSIKELIEKTGSGKITPSDYAKGIKILEFSDPATITLMEKGEMQEYVLDKEGIYVLYSKTVLGGKEMQAFAAIGVKDFASLTPADAPEVSDAVKYVGDENSGKWVVEEKLANSGDVLAEYSKNGAPSGDLSKETIFQPTMPGATISDGFACKVNRDTNHAGVDFAVKSGTDVYAIASGNIIAAGCGNGGIDPKCTKEGEGNRVVIDHKNGCFSGYYHLDEISVKMGDQIPKNTKTLIAKSGNTGSSTTGPHLHFEYYCGKPGSFEAQNPCGMLGITDPKCSCGSKAVAVNGADAAGASSYKAADFWHIESCVAEAGTFLLGGGLKFTLKTNTAPNDIVSWYATEGNDEYLMKFYCNEKLVSGDGLTRDGQFYNIKKGETFVERERSHWTESMLYVCDKGIYAALANPKGELIGGDAAKQKCTIKSG
ncbi:MAG: M23 family metallopeptidase, partial [Candidatus Micrarchaeota archaeon]